MSLSAGDRNVCLVIEQPASGEDALGQPVEGWADLDPAKSIWVKLTPKRGIETEQSDQRVASAFYYAEADYLEARGILTTMRARLDVEDPDDATVSRYFDIVSVLPDETSRDRTTVHLKEVIATQGF